MGLKASGGKAHSHDRGFHLAAAGSARSSISAKGAARLSRLIYRQHANAAHGSASGNSAGLPSSNGTGIDPPSGRFGSASVWDDSIKLRSSALHLRTGAIAI